MPPKYLIAHRGNVYGPKPERENSLEYIIEALNEGYHVETDVWLCDGKLFLGHDKPQYEVKKEFLQNDMVWCHAKNFAALEYFNQQHDKFHYFTHDIDDYTLSSKGVIWVYPGKQISESTILVMPELSNKSYREHQLNNVLGICSDYVGFYKQKLNAIHRVAMIISGRVKCYEDDLLPQLRTFYQENPDYYIDVFASLNYDPDEACCKSFRRDIFPTALAVELYKCDPKYMQHTNIRPEYDYQRYLIGNFMSHFYNNQKAFELLEKYQKENPDVQYDRVICYRADIVSPKLPSLKFEMSGKSVYFPAQNRFDLAWINMAIVMGDVETMRLYCSLYDQIDKYVFEEGMLLHPETMITQHLNRHAIRKNEVHFPYELDCRRRFTP